MNTNIRPNLWFDTEAEDAARFYTSVFKDSKLGTITYYPEAGQDITGMQPGMVLTVEFDLNGLHFVAINGGPHFKFNEAISLQIHCDDQDEIDYYWQKLGEGGDPEAQQCGWLKDKYGLSWQVSPKVMDEMLTDPDKSKMERAYSAMLTMKKLDIAGLQAAFNG